jgi:high-affinity nickel permease
MPASLHAVLIVFTAAVWVFGAPLGVSPGVSDRFRLSGSFWHGIALLNSNSGTIGCLVIAIFLASWIASAIIYRVRAYSRAEAKVS